MDPIPKEGYGITSARIRAAVKSLLPKCSSRSVRLKLNPKRNNMAYADKFPVSMKKGGNINKTAGKTTTGVVSNYKGYKGPKVKAQVAKVKKSKGKL